jgi:hypothetical protein
MCRKSGLERRRRCGFLENAGDAGTQAIWAGKTVAIMSCPTSYITPESVALLEEFHAWKLFGAADYYKMPARVVEAIFVLENELGELRRTE